MLVQRCVATASAIMAGSALPGLVGSMSGMTEVMPSTTSSREKIGNVARSTSPSW